MKKSILLLSLLVLAITACTEKNLIPVAYINVVEGSTFTPAEISAQGATVEIAFSTNYAWQIKGYSTLTWCSLDAIRGESGEGVLKVTVEPNLEDAVRTASFDIVAGAARQTVTLSQTETNALSIGTTEYSVLSEGGVVEIQVSANVDYTVAIPSDVTWIREPSTKVIENSYIMLVVDPSTEWFSRSAEITVTGKDVQGNDISIPVSITQEGTPFSSWTKSFSSDWTQIAATVPVHVAMHDGRLLVANASEIHAVDPETGDYIQKVDIAGLDVAPQSLANDSGGNLLIAANAACASEDFVIYSYDGSDVKELVRYGAGTLYTGTIGNVRVVGDLKTKAVVTAVASSVNYFVAWQIENGTVTERVNQPIPGNGIGDVVYGCVSPVSDDLDDGVLFIGYAGEPYSLYYCGSPASGEWTPVFDTGTAGNENFNSISITEFNGRKYCAVGQDGHFSWSVAPKVFVLDITDLPDVTTAYEGTFSGTFSYAGADDVKLAQSEDGLDIYLVNGGYDYAARIVLPE